MAVDQARNLNFFREMLSTSNNYSNNYNNTAPIQIGNNLINMCNDNSNMTNSLPPAMNDSLLFPFYNLNDVVFNSGVGKLPAPVKDDSGVTFNNSLVPPSSTSRKRQRELPVLPPAMVSGAGISSLLTPNASSSIVNKESNGFSFLGEDLSLQIMQQQLELDRLISNHMEKMRMEIEESKKQQLRRIMAAFGVAMAKKMREKEEEIEKINKTNWELEERLKTLCLQNQIWRDLAQTNEATANALRSNLEQVLQQVRENDAVRTAGELTDDAVSCCGSSGEVEERGRDQKRMRMCDNGENWVYRGKKVWSYSGESDGNRHCKKCGDVESTVLLLPCRHLCLCTSCGPTVNACPICHAAKNASVHVNLS